MSLNFFWRSMFIYSSTSHTDSLNSKNFSKIFYLSPDQKTNSELHLTKNFCQSGTVVFVHFFVNTIWLVKNFVKIGLLFQRGFEPTVARLVGSFFWWSLYKAKEWPEYNTSIACSIIREFFTLLFGAVHKLCRLAKGGSHKDDLLKVS